MIMALVVTVGFTAEAILATNLVVTDDFNRTGDLSGSTTSDGQYTWIEGNAGAAAVESQLNFNASGARAVIDNVRYADIQIEFDYIYQGSGADGVGFFVNYRVPNTWNYLTAGGAQDGYVVRLKRTAADNLEVRLYTDSAGGVLTTLTTANVVMTDYNTPTAIRITAVGTTHEVYVDGTQAYSITDSDTTSAGLFVLQDGGSYYRAIDNFSYSEITIDTNAAPSSLSLSVITGK